MLCKQCRPCSATSNLGLHCLPMFFLWDSTYKPDGINTAQNASAILKENGSPCGVKTGTRSRGQCSTLFLELSYVRLASHKGTLANSVNQNQTSALFALST